MTRKLPKRKPTPRLQCFDYKGQYAYSITICTHNNTPIFTGDEIVKVVLESLYSVCSKAQFHVLAYCFMPNHLHLLLVGAEKSDLVKTMKTFKQISSYQFKKAKENHCGSVVITTIS
ncbi:transposase [candidate division WOR-3 bacterium]|nr:transposase [candidate division WOR-3 bacterium]